MTPMRSVLVCHAGDAFDREGLSAWLGSCSDLVGMVILEEGRAQKRARIRRELKRVGPLRFADVLAMRLYQRLALARRDRRWLDGALETMRERYGALAPQVPCIVAASVNEAAVATFLREREPDLVLARCKQLLGKRLIGIPRLGWCAAARAG